MGGLVTFLAVAGKAVLTLGFLSRRRKRRRARLRQLEATVSVGYDDAHLWCDDGDGRQQVSWDQLISVTVETTDQRPFDDDAFVVIAAADGQFVFSAKAPGAETLLPCLQRLPAFDDEALTEALGATGNHIFNCWARHESTEQPPAG